MSAPTIAPTVAPMDEQQALEELDTAHIPCEVGEIHTGICGAIIFGIDPGPDFRACPKCDELWGPYFLGGMVRTCEVHR